MVILLKIVGFLADSVDRDRAQQVAASIWVDIIRCVPTWR